MWGKPLTNIIPFREIAFTDDVCWKMPYRSMMFPANLDANFTCSIIGSLISLIWGFVGQDTLSYPSVTTCHWRLTLTLTACKKASMSTSIEYQLFYQLSYHRISRKKIENQSIQFGNHVLGGFFIYWKTKKNGKRNQQSQLPRRASRDPRVPVPWRTCEGNTWLQAIQIGDLPSGNLTVCELENGP